MEINKEHIDKVLEFQGNYQSTRRALSSGQKELEELATKVKALSQELLDLRQSEKEFFEQLKEEHGEEYAGTLIQKLPEIFKL